MQALRIRIDRIVDFGTVVSLVGVDLESDQPVTIQLDPRPFAVPGAIQDGADFPQPIEYAANRLMLQLEMLPAPGTDGVLLVEHDSSVSSGGHSVQEGER